MNRRALPCTMAAAAALAVAGAQAQALTDPTRPPSSVSAPLEGQQDAPATQLQSVLLSSGRKLAVINGETVPLGGRIGEARVIRITETEVTLKKGDETEVLKLLPGIEKKPSRRGPVRAPGGAPGAKPARHGGAK